VDPHQSHWSGGINAYSVVQGCVHSLVVYDLPGFLPQIREQGWLTRNPETGLRLSAFHGNFFVRSTDLLAFSAVPIDQSYCIEVTHEDQLMTPFVVLQTGVLYTSCYGA